MMPVVLGFHRCIKSYNSIIRHQPNVILPILIIIEITITKTTTPIPTIIVLMIDGLRGIITNGMQYHKHHHHNQTVHTIIIIALIATKRPQSIIVSNIRNRSKTFSYCPIPATMANMMRIRHLPPRFVVMVYCTFTNGHPYIVSPMSFIGLPTV